MVPGMQAHTHDGQRQAPRNRPNIRARLTGVSQRKSAHCARRGHCKRRAMSETSTACATVIVSSWSSPRRSRIVRRPSTPTADRTCATVLERGNGWVLAMLVPPIEAGGPARGCAPAALSRGAVAPPCAPWPSGGVGARSTPTSRRARSPRGVEQGASFWCSRLKNARFRRLACSLTGHIDPSKAVHISWSWRRPKPGAG